VLAGSNGLSYSSTLFRATLDKLGDLWLFTSKGPFLFLHLNIERHPMITLSNGIRFRFVAASGALGNNGLGWPVERILGFFSKRLFDPSLFLTFAKTFTYDPRKGNFRWYNPLGCIKFIGDGVVNAYGLTNIGRKRWCKRYGRLLNSKNNPVAVSISGNPEELREMAIMLNDFDCVAVEINGSCPNDGSSLLEKAKLAVRSVEAVKAVTRFPIVFKWSVAQRDIAETAVREMAGLVDASAINSVPWSLIFSDKASPLAHLGGGGVSGKIAQPFTWGMARLLKNISDIPVIVPGAWDYSDIAIMEEIGDAVSFASVFMRYPWRPTCFVRRDMAE